MFVEEATETSRDLLEQLSLRMRGRASKHQIHLAFNPVSKLNFMYDFMVVRPPKDAVIIHSTYKDNRFLPKSYVEALEDLYRTNIRKAVVYCDGDWGSTGMVVFEDNWEVDAFDTAKILKTSHKIQARFGGDFGFTLDPTAVVGTLYDEDQQIIYVFGEIYQRGMTNIDLRNRIMQKQWHKQLIYFDSADPKSITELNRMNLKIRGAKKGRDSILYGVSFLQRHKIIVHPDCKNMIAELSDYQYKKDKNTGNYNMEKFEGADHIIDALRYAYSDYYSSGSMTTLKKIMLGV